MRMVKTLRDGVAVLCATALVSAPALMTSTATATQAESMPQALTIKVGKTSISVRGGDALRAGRVTIKAKGIATSEVVKFAEGYAWADFKKDVVAAEGGDMKALRRAIAKTDFLGGTGPGSTATITLPGPGVYDVWAFGPRGPKQHTTLTAGPKMASDKPEVDGKIIARAGPKWGGSSELPAKGTFLFKNADATVPHFVALQQVVEGTTTDEVLETLQSEEQGGPPPWALPGSLETASLSSGNAMAVGYDLPPGQYVVMCFFPDPKMGGMPHAFMGMLRMIHLT